MIKEIIKHYSYSNRENIYISEIDLLINDSPLVNNYLIFLENKQLEMGIRGNILNKEEDLSTISLIPYDSKIDSTTCNIFISGFMSEMDILIGNWKGMIKSIHPNQVCYFYNWPSQTKILIFDRFCLVNGLSFFPKTIGLDARNETIENQFLISKQTSKNAGKMLAFILASRKVFTYKTINLIGFSLGVNVIKNCIKQLYRIHTEMHIPCDNIIQSTLMMAGASVIRDAKKEDYANYYNTIVSGRAIHCFSSEDLVLELFFIVATKKQPIGNKKLEIQLDKLENYDFSDLKLGHRNYGEYQDKIAERIKINNE